MNQAPSGIDRFVGRWHLVDFDANEVELPQHRVDIVIRHGTPGLTGAVLSRTDGNELQDVALLVQCDGETLRLQMHDLRFPEQAAPWLVLDEMLQGRWHDSANQPIGPKLKLVRAKN